MATHPRSDIYQYASTSNAMANASMPIASTSNSAMSYSSATTTSAPLSTAPVDTSTSDPSSRKQKKKKQGRGREMMVKVFYSLNSPSNHSAPTPPPASIPTPKPMVEPSLDFPLDPALAALPPAVQPSQTQATTTSIIRPHRYSCLARLSAPVWVQLLGSRPSEEELDQGKTEYGRLTLKTCLGAICISRPELVTDPSKDYAVSALDPYESSLAASSSSSTSSNADMAGQGLVEGKGMLSWNLAEKREGTTWVCGKVVANEREAARRRSKRRKVETEMGNVVDDEESSDDEDGVIETLEVWLQLAEKPAFTQLQFLTSLRSFANPAQQPNDSSDRASSPPRRASLQSNTARQDVTRSLTTVVTGDPIKRKRPRDSDEKRLSLGLAAPRSRRASGAFPSTALDVSIDQVPATSSISTSTYADITPTLDDPRIASLLAQLLPSLADAVTDSKSTSSSATLSALSLDAEKATSLLPAIQTLADYYGVQASTDVTNASNDDISVTTSKGKGGDETAASQKEPTEAFTPIADQAPLADGAKGRFNPADANGGCFNCRRKKSTVWREMRQADGTRVTACNACGAHYNKYGRHRTKGDKTSPVRGAQAVASASTTTKAGARRGGRPLQGRLTAACESELKKSKTKKVAASSSRGVPGVIPPPSPSKHIGPRLTPGNSFRGGPFGAFTSPSRHSASRNRSAHRSGGSSSNPFGFAATSPTRASHHHHHRGAMASGLHDGYDSEGDTRVTPSNDFPSMFGPAHQSPSPNRPANRAMPTYLLTASPGTALDRILNDTNVNLDSFGMSMNHSTTTTTSFGQHRPDALTGDASLLKDSLREHLIGGPDDDEEEGTLDRALSFYLTSLTPTEEDAKENERPKNGSEAFSMIDPSLLPPTTGAATSTAFAPTTDADPFESVLSSLRRDFNTRLSSNALTAPSSPIPSSPCVQPRTSSATPGQKGKGPASCGRPAPSIVNSFLDGLVPALAFPPAQTNGATPASDSDAWTPASLGAGSQNEDTTMTLDQFQRTTATISKSPMDMLLPHHPATAKHLLPHLHQSTSEGDFDFGSLPPSSPPALPSEAGPTPSEFGSCITPDEDGYVDETHSTTSGTAGDDATMMLVKKVASGGKEGNEALQALLTGTAGDTVQLDRSTLDKLLSMIGKSSTSAEGSKILETGSREVEKMYADMFK